MTRSRRKPPQLRRSKHSREPKRRFILFCEGAKTEVAYFEAVRRACSSTLINVETHGGVGDPSVIARTAINRAKFLGLTPHSRRQKDSYEKRDQVWAVFDRDEHSRFNEAVANCESQNVGVGRSDPCFELWLILHEQDFDRPEHRHAVQKMLAKLRPEYDRDGPKTPDCNELVKRVEAAERRSEIQLRRRIKEDKPYGNPSTTVGRLTREIREADALAARP